MKTAFARYTCDEPSCVAKVDVEDVIHPNGWYRLSVRQINGNYHEIDVCPEHAAAHKSLLDNSKPRDISR